MVHVDVNAAGLGKAKVKGRLVNCLQSKAPRVRKLVGRVKAERNNVSGSVVLELANNTTIGARKEIGRNDLRALDRTVALRLVVLEVKVIE